MASNYRQVACLVCMVAVAAMCTILASLSNEAKDTASRVKDALERWDRKNLQGTVAWRARVLLASLSWLGPLRPVPPEDPLIVCGIMVEASCPNLPLVAPVTGRLLRCLEVNMKEVEEDHFAFQGKLLYPLFFILWVVALGVVVLLKHTAYQRGKTCHDGIDVTLTEAEVIDRGLDSDSFDEQSSDGYDDCQEETFLHPPGGGSQATTEDRVCAISDNTEYCDHLSPEKHEDCNEGIDSLPSTESSQGCKEDVASNSTVPPPVSVYADDYYLNKLKKKRRGKKAVDGDSADDDDGGEWRIMKRKNKERIKSSRHEEKLSSSESKETQGKMDGNQCPKPLPGRSLRTGAEQRPKRSAGARRKPAPTDALREAMRQQWREAKTQVLLEVPPQRRRHVIGRHGETVRMLRRTFPDVDVLVPVPSDATSGHVVLHGPEKQVTAAAQYITARLKEAEAKIEEAKRRREESRPITAVVEAEPAMRGLIVGPGGERLLRLAQEYPRVRVTVPPPSNTSSRTIKLRGPPGEVAAVKTSLEATLQEERRRREAREARKAAHIKALTKKRAPRRK